MPTHKISQRVILSVVAFCVVLSIAAGFLVHKSHETLVRLLHPESIPVGTDVYSRWLELDPNAPVSWERTIRWLDLLEYHRAQGPLAKPGDYRVSGNTVEVFARPFHYFDKDYPAQLIELSYSDAMLKGIQAFAGKATLPEWRLEPKRLAGWLVDAKTTRSPVRVSELPPYVPRAVLAIEDKRYFQHGAFDPEGIVRALWVDIRHVQLRQGASTISQQLARSIFLDVHRTWRRKIMEAVLAFYLELRYSKPQLLEIYLNQVYWGQDGTETLIGIESASQSLFGKPARQLTVAESAALAGMLQSPRRYSPRNASAIPEDRKRMVLGLMRDQQAIDAHQYHEAIIEKIRLGPMKKTDDAAYFLAKLREDLGQRYELGALLSGGWKIFTTLDPLLQRDAVRALKPSAGQAALVVLDPHTGAVLAWVGGTNFQTNPYDHAGDARRQPGSAFKPFVALAALESKKMTTATLLEDKPLTLKGIQGNWKPQNYDRKYRGKTSVWNSVVDSLNVPIVRLAMQIGLPPIVDVSRRAGITSPLREDLSLALGTSEVSVLELTGAYATLATGGQRLASYETQAVVGEDGRLLESATVTHESAFAPEVIYLVTQMLEEVLKTGTGKAAKELGWTFPAAGKTGTSENFQDAWFLGYTTELVCGVWVGYDKPQSLGHSAAGIALPLWIDFMRRAAVYDHPNNFAEPKDLVWRNIDPASGMLARTGCPSRRKAYFLPATEPAQDCPLHSGGLTGLFKRWRGKI